MNVIHLSHTDINFDSRILKEINSLTNSNEGFTVNGIGVELKRNISDTKKESSTNIFSINLKTRTWILLPRFFRHLCSLLELTFKMVLILKKLKPDVIHCHDNLVLHVGVVYKIFSDVKLIYDAHELESEKNGNSTILSKITLFSEKIFWRSIDALIVVSPSINDWYQKNIGVKPTEIIFNSPMFSNFQNIDKMYLRKKFNIPSDAYIYIYIGIVMPGRGIDLMVESFRNENCKDHLVFLGYGTYKDKLINIASNQSNIHFHDSVPHEDVVPIAKSADIGLCLVENVSLSNYFCLPNKLFEYAFSGIPVLASDFPDISSLVQKYNLGKCCNLELGSILKAINEFHNHNQLPKINVNTLQNLSWESQEEKLLKLYKKILKD